MNFSKNNEQYIINLNVEHISTEDVSAQKPCKGNCKNCSKNHKNRSVQEQDLFKKFYENL